MRISPLYKFKVVDVNASCIARNRGLLCSIYFRLLDQMGRRRIHRGVTKLLLLLLTDAQGCPETLLRSY